VEFGVGLREPGHINVSLIIKWRDENRRGGSNSDTALTKGWFWFGKDVWVMVGAYLIITGSCRRFDLSG
jgi:hypothetical protein